MFKMLKRFILFLLFVVCVGGAIYLPLRMHFVRYDSRYHMVKKGSMGWDNTYINLDENKTKWWLVMRSTTLRAYFLEYYPAEIKKKLDKGSSSFWQKIKKKSSESIENLRKKLKKESLNQIKKQSTETLNDLQKKAVEGYKNAKKKGKKMLDDL